MFSITTTASSTTKPVAMVSAMRVRLLRLKPASAITAKVPSNDSGTTTIGTSAARRLRRNNSTTSTTSATAMKSARSTSRNEARMVGVRSIVTCNCIAAGIEACNCGSRARIRSTVSMMLASG